MEQEVANKMIVFGDGDLRQVQRVALKGLLLLAPVQRAQSHRKTAERQLPFGRFVRYLCMVEPRFDPDSTKNSLVHSLHFLWIISLWSCTKVAKSPSTEFITSNVTTRRF